MHVHIARAKRDAGKVKNDPLFVPISQSGNTRAFFYQVRTAHVPRGFCSTW